MRPSFPYRKSLDLYPELLQRLQQEFATQAASARGSSLFMRFGDSNRGRYEKLEIDATYTKQKVEIVSNRGNFSV